MKSILAIAGLPEEFGITLLILSLILTLSPWLSGADFGIFKIPQFSQRARSIFRVIGPSCLIAAIIIHIPIIGPIEENKPVHKSTSTPDILPYKQDSLNIWKIGSPHSGNVPSTNLNPDIIRKARDLRIDIDVKALAPQDFAKNLFAAVESNSEPDMIVVNNYGLLVGITTSLGTFTGISSKKEIKDSIIEVTGGSEILDWGMNILLSSSRHHDWARSLILDTVECEAEITQNIHNIKNTELEDMRAIAKSAVFGYLTCDLETIAKVSDADRLGTGCISNKEPFFVKKIKVCGFYGNSKLAFAPIMASVSNEKSLGHVKVLSIFRNINNKWKLLIVTVDPQSLRMFGGPIQTLAKRLLEKSSGTESRMPEPATLLTPNWEYPAPILGERFGNFVWRSSPSENVFAEIVEFEYGYSTRLFLVFDKSAHDRKFSTGNLWTIDGTWHWRVWSISENGSLALSEHKSFIH